MVTRNQIELVESSWDFVILNTCEAGDIFYDKLFQLDPQLRRLFKNDIVVQAQKLVSMITFVVHNLENLSDLKKDVEALGYRHAKHYEVKPEHYSTVKEALLWTLERSLGAQWNDELKKAWEAVYKTLAAEMQRHRETI